MGFVGLALCVFVATVAITEIGWWAYATYKQWRKVQITASLASRFDYDADAHKSEAPHHVLRDKVNLHRTAQDLGCKKPKAVFRW